MAETLDGFIASLPVHEQQAIHAKGRRLIAEEMTLRTLRKVREISQRAVGEKLNINQAAVSKIEHRTDMYISTLREYIAAMGGELDIVARFPDRDPVRINQFEDLAAEAATEEDSAATTEDVELASSSQAGKR